MRKFKEGFEFEGFKYGFKKQILYRLPITKNNRNYPLRIVPIINLSKTSRGYRLCRQKKSQAQVRSMVQKVDWEINNNCKQCT